MAVKAQNLSHEATRELLVLITLLFHSGGRVGSCSSCQGQVLEQRVSSTREVPAGRKQVGVRRRWSLDGTKRSPGLKLRNYRGETTLPEAVYQVCG